MGLENYKALLNFTCHNSLKVTPDICFAVVGDWRSMLLGLVAAVLCNKTFPGIQGLQHSLCASYGDRLSSARQ